MLNVRFRLLACASAALFCLLITIFYVGFGTGKFSVSPSLTSGESSPKPTRPPIKYKPVGPPKSLPIVDNFPLAASAQSPADLPPVAEWVKPPAVHVPEKTPLFIGFTRNWRLLQQVVVSYINAGWPPSDIYVVENTGVMFSNKNGQLTLQNPFFLNHTRLHLFEVNILITPTLLTFAQLQNFYLYHSITQNWTHYFWSHMDVAVLAFEDQYAEHHPTIPPLSDPLHDYSDFSSLYQNCVKELRLTNTPKNDTGKVEYWAMRFFSYDRLALVNVQTFIDLGGWDTLIPFYMTDCDMHARISMINATIQEVFPGMVFDVGSTFDDLLPFYRKKGVEKAHFQDPNAIEEALRIMAEEENNNTLEADSKEVKTSKQRRDDGTKINAGEIRTKWEDDEIYSEDFRTMIRTLDDMSHSKWANARGRNTWQSRQRGGEGDPFYRDSEGFETGLWMTVEHGKRVYAEKWGHRDCDIAEVGLKIEDAWRVEHDWD